MMKARAKAGERTKPKAQAKPNPRATPNVPSFAPAVILIAPQLGENIGFAARAMANFGLAELRLVNPRDGWPNERAQATASKADHIIEATKVYETLEQAIADLNFVYATTARERDGYKPVRSPVAAAETLRAKFAAGEGTGILFGRER